jgi:hypothetical protein
MDRGVSRDTYATSAESFANALFSEFQCNFASASARQQPCNVLLMNWLMVIIKAKRRDGVRQMSDSSFHHLALAPSKNQGAATKMYLGVYPILGRGKRKIKGRCRGFYHSAIN